MDPNYLKEVFSFCFLSSLGNCVQVCHLWKNIILTLPLYQKWISILQKTFLEKEEKQFLKRLAIQNEWNCLYYLIKKSTYEYQHYISFLYGYLHPDIEKVFIKYQKEMDHCNSYYDHFFCFFSIRKGTAKSGNLKHYIFATKYEKITSFYEYSEIMDDRILKKAIQSRSLPLVKYIIRQDSREKKCSWYEVLGLALDNDFQSLVNWLRKDYKPKDLPSYWKREILRNSFKTKIYYLEKEIAFFLSLNISIEEIVTQIAIWNPTHLIHLDPWNYNPKIVLVNIFHSTMGYTKDYSKIRYDLSIPFLMKKANIYDGEDLNQFLIRIEREGYKKEVYCIRNFILNK